MINYHANLTATIVFYYSVLVQHTLYKNSSVDEIANVNFYAVRPEDTRIR